MKPIKIYYEPEIKDYALGKKLLDKFSDIEKFEIKSHNNIEELRNKSNADFVEMKKYLIIGTRKTHKYVDNEKISDFLVPYTSSGCSAMCLYCYLVCNYNKCSYLRLYVNVEEILDKLILKSKMVDKPLTYEVGSNSDLVLENQITNNLIPTIEQFAKYGKGNITFPSKFSMVDDILPLNHNGKVIFRMSVNPQEIISKVEFGTSSLDNRIKAINNLCEAGYKVGIILAPVIFLENWQKLYVELLDILESKLTEKVKNQLTIEVIFMTYSYVQKAINDQAFPNAVDLFNKELMTGRGRGKYCYKQEYRDRADLFLRAEIGKRFDCAEIVYVV